MPAVSGFVPVAVLSLQSVVLWLCCTCSQWFCGCVVPAVSGVVPAVNGVVPVVSGLCCLSPSFLCLQDDTKLPASPAVAVPAYGGGSGMVTAKRGLDHLEAEVMRATGCQVGPVLGCQCGMGSDESNAGVSVWGGVR